jgi:hypothetical protein
VCLNFFAGDDSSGFSALRFDRFCDKVFLNFFDGDDSSEFSALHFDGLCAKVFLNFFVRNDFLQFFALCFDRVFRLLVDMIGDCKSKLSKPLLYNCLSLKVSSQMCLM